MVAMPAWPTEVLSLTLELITPFSKNTSQLLAASRQPSHTSKTVRKEWARAMVDRVSDLAAPQGKEEESTDQAERLLEALINDQDKDSC